MSLPSFKMSFPLIEIYIDAIRLKEFENRKLDDMAEEIYDRAKRLLEKDELLVPFTNFNEDASKYLNTEVNKIIKNLVHNFLKYRNIEINWYKDEPQLCYFTNPFHKQNIGPQTYRNITFDNVSSYQSEKTEFINLEHPFVTLLRRKISNAASFGTVSALRLNINKFSGVSGVLFVYKLLIQNNVDKEKIAIISIFLEDEDFCNRRISAYLENFTITDAMIVQNYTCDLDIDTYADAALKEAKEKANDIFTATKLTWLEEVMSYEERSEEYYRFKENAVKNIQVDNIRESKMKSLMEERKSEINKFKLKKNIVPKLELYQVSHLEFI